MKVLIISDAWHPQINGVVRTYEHLGAELEKLGHTVKVIGPADFPVKIPMPGYPEIKLAIAPYKRLTEMIREYAPDTVHISVEGPLGWAGRRYCLEHNLPFTTTYHTQFPDYVAKRLARFTPFLYNHIHELGKKYVRNFHAHSKVLLVATQSLEDELASWDFQAPMHRLTRGADLDIFQPGEKTLFHDLPKPVAIYVGRVAIEKSIEDFLSMEWEGSKIVVGEGPSLTTLEKEYPDTHFVGKKTEADLAAHYRSADLFVFPSRTDTFGMVLIEALACGIPVAAYNVTGPKDIVTEPFLGALHDTDLAHAAKEALTRGTPEERVNFVRQFYTWEVAGAQFEDALKKNGITKT